MEISLFYPNTCINNVKTKIILHIGKYRAHTKKFMYENIIFIIRI